MDGLGPRFAIERAQTGNSRPTVVRACALLDGVGHQVGRGSTGHRRNPYARRKAAAFHRWHEPDDARASCPVL